MLHNTKKSTHSSCCPGDPRPTRKRNEGEGDGGREERKKERWEGRKEEGREEGKGEREGRKKKGKKEGMKKGGQRKLTNSKALKIFAGRQEECLLITYNLSFSQEFFQLHLMFAFKKQGGKVSPGNEKLSKEEK